LAASFLDLLGIRGNPLEKVGRLYYLLIFVTISCEIIRNTGLFYLSYIAYLANEMKDIRYLAPGYVVLGWTSLIAGLISSLFGLLEAYLLYKAGNYMNDSRLSAAGGLYLLSFLIMLLLLPANIAFIFAIARTLAGGKKISMRLLQPILGLSMIVLIAAFIAIIGLILYLLFIYDIGKKYDMSSANSALGIRIIHLLFVLIAGSIIGGVSYILYPSTASTQATLNIISALFLIIFYYYVSQMFEELGEYYRSIEENPAVIDNALEELARASEPINIRDFIKEKKIPYEVFTKKLEEKIMKGEIKGSILRETFYPSGAESSSTPTN